jgi:hypothetical protein
MNEERKIDQPYANCDHDDNSALVPNSNSGSKHERLSLKR